MGQDELVLKVPQTVDPSKGSIRREPDPQDNNPSNSKRSHSRESSGASNLSVKFTVHKEGSNSPKASVKTAPFQYDATLKPSSSSLRNRDPDRQRKRNLRTRFDSKSDPEELGFDSDHSNTSLASERLSPVDGTQDPRMFHGDPKSQNSDYGSFCNTPSDTFVPNSSPVAAGVTTVPGGGVYQGTTSDQQHRGHQRNDSEIQMISDASQRRPLLDAHHNDSSSEDEASGKNTFSYSRQRSRQHWAGGGGGPVAIDIPTQDVAANEDSDSDEEDHIPAEPLKTLLSAIFMLFGWIATTTSLALTHERVPDISPLPDVFLDNTNYQSWGLDASEILIMIIVWSAFFIVIFHQHRSVVLRRIFLLLGLHYSYRAITMFITVLPKSNPEYVCAPKLNETTAGEIFSRVIKLLSGMGLSINGKHIYCGDYIYSGHTMTLVTAYLVIKEYSPKSWFLLHWGAMLTSIAGVVLLMLARGHYSIDVLIAYWITTRIWWIYHTLANNDILKGDMVNPQNYLAKIWWWYIFRYFEKNVPPNLPRKFGWPIPKKLRRWKPAVNFFRRPFFRFGNSQQQPSANPQVVAEPDERTLP